MCYLYEQLITLTTKYIFGAPVILKINKYYLPKQHYKLIFGQ